MENTLVGAGIVFMAGALIGGGLSAFGITLPLFASVKRQVLLFLFGAVLLAGGLDPGLWHAKKHLGTVMGPLEPGINRQGYDFDDAGLPAANAPICAELCRTNKQCVAMTYVISLRTCWLKSKVPPQSPDADMISAVKDGA
jgi:PAN domain-containing protein